MNLLTSFCRIRTHSPKHMKRIQTRPKLLTRPELQQAAKVWLTKRRILCPTLAGPPCVLQLTHSRLTAIPSLNHAHKSHMHLPIPLQSHYRRKHPAQFSAIETTQAVEYL